MPVMRVVWLLGVLIPILLSIGCRTSHRGHEQVSAADPPKTQYAGLQTRDIKALSEEEIEGLLAGGGMGLAMVAELNQHPGPKHVLENLAELALTPKQQAAAQEVMDRTLGQASLLGAEIVARERELDAMFQTAESDTQAIHELMLDIGRLRGELRWTHVAAHIEMKQHLETMQIVRYDELRGYTSEDGGAHHHGAHSGSSHGDHLGGSQP